MSDRLLYHYEKELAFIKQSASDFARQHPSVAESLKLGTDTVDDPLVARLLSGFAFLNARIQQKLSDDFPELTDAMKKRPKSDAKKIKDVCTAGF